MALASSPRVAAGVFVLLCGCAGGGQGASASDAGALDTGPPPIASLSFSIARGLKCADAGAAVEICVAPARVVTFGIDGPAGTTVTLSLQGDYGDAALMTSAVTLTGTTSNVMLQPSSTAATFSVVARVGTWSISLLVHVASSGTATIEAAPIYAGHRPTAEFYATEFDLVTCAELTAAPPNASAAPWTAGPSGVAIALRVPAGERAAVQMRVGHYALGCADVDPLVPNATLALPVQVYDVPMALALTNLDATLWFTLDAAALSAWSKVAGAAIARIEGAFFASNAPDGIALLDAMRTAIGASAAQAEFDQLRQKGGWDATATSWMSSRVPPLSINARAATWLGAAASDPIGALALHISGGTGNGTAPVTVGSLGALTWVGAGIAQPAPFQWTADANDTIHVSGAIDLASTPLFAHQADLHAASAAPSATDCPTAIAAPKSGIDCAGFASQLVGTGVSYGSCFAGCTANLCVAALTAAWKSVAAPAGGGADAVHLTITASAPADVGDLAEPAYVGGGWLGSVSGNGGVPTPFTVTGTVLATEPPGAPP